MKRNQYLFFLLLLFTLSCTAETHDLAHVFDEAPKGFLWGLWHGAIAVGTFIFSLFSDSVTVYEVNNNGLWYDLGFLLGIGAFSSSAGRASKRSRS